MKISFSKYHGAGNDFIIIDNRNNQFKANREFIANLCHRQFGIGADGLMLLEMDTACDFRMRYFNADGNESTMCGNGGRCIALYAQELGIIGAQARFRGVDGEHHAIINSEISIKLHMKDVETIEHDDDDYFLLDTGSPHYVRFVEDVDKIDVANEGRFLSKNIQSDMGGVNVNFVQVVVDGIKVRTYERGVEAETLSCGTGAVASAIVANSWLGEGKMAYNIQTRGGILGVSFDKSANDKYFNIWLTGPAKHVFDGIVENIPD